MSDTIDEVPHGIPTEAEYGTGRRIKHPAHCIHKSHGKCRVLYYSGNGYFMLLDSRDAKVFAPRRLITFIKG